MSDDYTDYSGMYPTDPEPETVEDLPLAVEEFVDAVEEIDVEPVVEEEEVVEELPVEEVVEEEIVEEVVEDVAPVVENPSMFVRANIDDGAQLRVRATPDGEILTLVTNIPSMKVLNDDNPEWTLVEFEEVGETVTGYIKKTFLVEV